MRAEHNRKMCTLMTSQCHQLSPETVRCDDKLNSLTTWFCILYWLPEVFFYSQVEEVQKAAPRRSVAAGLFHLTLTNMCCHSAWRKPRHGDHEHHATVSVTTSGKKHRGFAVQPRRLHTMPPSLQNENRARKKWWQHYWSLSENGGKETDFAKIKKGKACSSKNSKKKTSGF